MRFFPEPTITASFPRRTGKTWMRWWPEILLITAALLTCARFPQYLPTTPDDYGIAINNLKHQFGSLIQGEWVKQNRLQWFFSFPIYIAVTKALFFLRWTGGIHIAFLFAPPLALYFALRCRGLILEARLGSCMLLAIQALGYEHTTPLGYPIYFLAANAISIASGFQLGRLTSIRKESKKQLLLPSAACVIAGSLSGLLYETFPLLFLIAALWGYSAPANQIVETKANKSTFADWPKLTAQLLLFTAPILVMIGLKGLGWLLAKDMNNFNTYKGNSINPADLTPAYIITSLQIAFNTLIGSTVAGHTHRLMSWPEMPVASMSTITAWLYGSLVAAATWLTLSPSNRRLGQLQQRHRVAEQVIALTSLASMTGVQLLFHSLTPRHHEWFTLSANPWTRTYLNASMAVSTAAFALAVAASMLSCWPLIKSSRFQRIWPRLTALLLTGVLGTAGYLSMTHNLQIATIIRNRATGLEDIVTTCHYNATHSRLTDFAMDPPALQLPFLIHAGGLDKSVGTHINTICRDALARPNLFSRWGSGELSEEQMANVSTYGTRTPSAFSILDRAVIIPTSTGIESPNDDIAWAWLSGTNTTNLKLRHLDSFPKNWTLQLIPSPQYQELSLEVLNEAATSKRIVQVGSRGIDLSKLIAKGGDVIVVGAQPSGATTSAPIATPLPLSTTDVRKAYFRVEVSRVKATTNT